MVDDTACRRTYPVRGSARVLDSNTLRRNERTKYLQSMAESQVSIKDRGERQERLEGGNSPPETHINNPNHGRILGHAGRYLRTKENLEV